MCFILFILCVRGFTYHIGIFGRFLLYGKLFIIYISYNLYALFIFILENLLSHLNINIWKHLIFFIFVHSLGIVTHSHWLKPASIIVDWYTCCYIQRRVQHIRHGYRTHSSSSSSHWLGCEHTIHATTSTYPTSNVRRS